MSSDLIAWVVAITLGIAVVALGLRRNLSETTRNGLPPAAFAVLSAHDRLFNAILAATFALNAAVLWRKRSPSSLDGSAF